jgi:predicted HTH transcriptional regulator
LDVLKSIAGFLNTDGGNLYIGVEEDQFGRPSLRGLEEDLKLAGSSKDRLQLSLRDLIATRIGSVFSPLITD